MGDNSTKPIFERKLKMKKCDWLDKRGRKMAVYVNPETLETARSTPARVHWVPCHIEHNGSANVSQYFQTCIREKAETGT